MRLYLGAPLIGFLALSSTVADAQQGVSSIRGRVVDSQGGVLPGVSVVITHQALYADIRLDNDGNRNGSFFFNTDRAYNPADPSTYPERLSIRHG